MLFDSPDISPFQNFTTDLELGRADMPPIEDWRFDASESRDRDSWDHLEALQAHVARVMQSETAAVHEINPAGLTTSFAEDDSFVSHGKDFRVATEGEENEDIVVVGRRKPGYEIVWDGSDTGGEPTGGDGGAGDGGGGGIGEPTEPLPDEATVDIEINIDRPLTDSEKEALEDLKETIAALEAAIMALADNAVLTLPNGADVTGAELKAIWAKTDFVINDNNFTYQNGGQGEARMAYGEPTISFNIGYVDAYNNDAGGMNYLVAHELGHLSQAGTSYYTDQRTANDIARALLDGAGLDYLDEPGFGYTPDAPKRFSVNSNGGGGGGGPGGGGGGCGGDGSGEETCW